MRFFGFFALLVEFYKVVVRLFVDFFKARLVIKLRLIVCDGFDFVVGQHVVVHPVVFHRFEDFVKVWIGRGGVIFVVLVFKRFQLPRDLTFAP